MELQKMGITNQFKTLLKCRISTKRRTSRSYDVERYNNMDIIYGTSLENMLQIYLRVK